MSLDRLLNLVKKTGDRLVVHDPINERDVVIMDLDSYEDLLSMRPSERSQMSEAELLNQINRDIADWRARRANEDFEQFFDTDFSDADFSDNDFSEAGEILPLNGDEPQFMPVPADEEPLPGDFGSATEEEPHPPANDVKEDPVAVVPPKPKTSPTSPWKSTAEILGNRFKPATEGGEQALPKVEYQPNPEGNTWKEEPLQGDEPVFYEEPIN